MIPLEEARTRAAACGFPVRADGVIESDRWWFFPVLQIGSFGVVVDKADGRCTCLGSAGRLEDWLSAYDAGLLEQGDIAVVVARMQPNPVEPTWSEPLQASALEAYVRWWGAPDGQPPPLSPPPDEGSAEATDVLLHELEIRGPKALVVFDATDPVTLLRHRHHWIVEFSTPTALAHIARFSRPA